MMPPYSSRSKWRLLITPPAHGFWNMAVDEAILEAVGAGESQPTLRLYAWEPPCLSLGYAQPYEDVDMSLLQARGWEIVRRPTGGRAILHTDELTYSVIGPADEYRLSGGVLESYQRLSQALLAALHLLGVPAQADPKPGAASDPLKGPVCFEVPSNYEITVSGLKLIGSAQSRRRDSVLQHGSLPISGDLGRITQALCCPSEEQRQLNATRLLARATTLEKILGYLPTWDDVARCFIKGFEETLALDLLPGDLSAVEAKRAAQLSAQKYANPHWTQRV
jgi:lipoate-protein ligase A